MVKEEYVSYEVAKLLKEKGFVTPCDWLYCSDGTFGHRNSLWDKEMFPAPTQQMAMRWLREEHDIFIDVGYDDLDFYWLIESIADDVPIQNRPKLLKNGTACHRTYEQAVESAIKYCLENLI